MKILHTVEFYSPSVGGAQEVVRQISERLAARGHDVTVATTRLKKRGNGLINGVKIEEFDISGNAVYGMRGEIEHYQRFLIEGKFDIMMNYAAQQWSMDLVFTVLEQIPYRKVMIPCGFSALYSPDFEKYFEQMPGWMRKYDHLVFHAGEYRDVNFAREHRLDNYSIIPNGASQNEFEQDIPAFRRRFHIPEEALLLLTVGSHTGTKGHRLCMDAFQQMDLEQASLVIIGNTLDTPLSIWSLFIRPFLSAIKHHDIKQACKLIIHFLSGTLKSPGCLSDCYLQARKINRNRLSNKGVFLLNPPRIDVVAAYQSADLFILGSNVEYSPLVLYESMASKTPFVTLACGNSAEIVKWGGGGIVAPTLQKKEGYVDGDPAEFARVIESLLKKPPEMTRLAEAGHRAWLEHFTWEKIALEYETLYYKLTLKNDHAST
jgi:glycosyltransferase involved in cell wall biosynthesis